MSELLLTLTVHKQVKICELIMKCENLRLSLGVKTHVPESMHTVLLW